MLVPFSAGLKANAASSRPTSQTRLLREASSAPSSDWEKLGIVGFDFPFFSPFARAEIDNVV